MPAIYQSPAKRGKWFFLVLISLFFSLSALNAQAYFDAYLASFPSFLNNIIEIEDEPINLNFTQNGAVISTASPVSLNPSDPLTGIIIYEVQKDDTLMDIANQFNISINTIKWANNLRGDIIKIGDKLEILPVTGIKHIVKKGDTIAALAKKYRSIIDKIIDFNALPADGDLQIGDIIIIPDGEMPTPPKPKVLASPKIEYPTLKQNYFSMPVASGYRSQGLHRFNAVDLASECYTPILAAAEGIVIEVNLTNSKSKWANHGYGNYIKIIHPNGIVTLYAHLYSAFAKEGQMVSKGQEIALMGGQPRTSGAGKSTACHLHFEVRGARNPFTRGPLALNPNNQ